MWFRSQAGNRQRQRSSVLEVRNRSEPVRRNRRRLVLAAFMAAVLALVVFVAGSEVWAWARQRLLDTGLFALHTIEVVTEGNWMAPEQVKQWAGVREGANLLTVDLSRIRRDLELVPQIESASVERVLPHLLRLRVTEREPLARVQALSLAERGGFVPATYYLDAGAVVMPALPAEAASAAFRQALEALPVVRGLAQRDLCPGRAIDSRAVRAALELLAGLERSDPGHTPEVTSIDVSARDVLLVSTAEGSQLTLGLENLDRQVWRWRLVREAGLRLGKAVARLDLSLTNNCPVTWAELSNAPPAKTPPARLPRSAKSHV